MSVPYNNRMFHDEQISDSNHSGDALDDNWVEDGQEADVSICVHEHALFVRQRLKTISFRFVVVRSHPHAC